VAGSEKGEEKGKPGEIPQKGSPLTEGNHWALQEHELVKEGGKNKKQWRGQNPVISKGGHDFGGIWGRGCDGGGGMCSVEVRWG